MHDAVPGIVDSQCGTYFSVYEYDRNKYVHLLMVISRDPPNWDVTAVSPADQWNQETLEGS